VYIAAHALLLYSAVATVDEDDLAADQVRSRRCQEKNQVCNLQRRPDYLSYWFKVVQDLSS
jgi:hypothetical protein